MGDCYNFYSEPVGEKTMRPRIGEKKGVKVTNARITLNFKLETLGIILKIRDSKPNCKCLPKLKQGIAKNIREIL